MGSPFPLYSSGQSIPDERQGYSPRDFGMVPHTPQIRGHRMSSDQSVPRTPDAGVLPNSANSQAGVTEGLPATPCLSTTGSQHSTHLLSRDSPNTGPDQQVPVTPQGGYLLTRYQSPIPYYTHFNSPSLSLESSQEIAATRADSANANPHTNTPSRINNPFECAKLERYATQNRFSRANNTPPGAELHTNSRRLSIAHTRQTPSLSSRRRLTLEPCRLESSDLRVVQNNQLIKQITMTTSDENCSRPRNDSISTSSGSFHHAANDDNSHVHDTTQISHSEDSWEPDKDDSDIEIEALGYDQNNNNNNNNNNKSSNNNDNNNDNIINNNNNNDNIINNNNSNNNNVNPRGSTVLPGFPKRDHNNIVIPIVRDSGDNLVAIDDQKQQVHRGGHPNLRTPPLFGDADQMDSSTLNGSDSKRAEIEKRVQRVLDRGTGTSTGTRTSPVPATHSASMELEDDHTSVLTLFAEDDYIFG